MFTRHPQRPRQPASGGSFGGAGNCQQRTYSSYWHLSYVWLGQHETAKKLNVPLLLALPRRVERLPPALVKGDQQAGQHAPTHALHASRYPRGTWAALHSSSDAVWFSVIVGGRMARPACNFLSAEARATNLTTHRHAPSDAASCGACAHATDPLPRPARAQGYARC